MTRQIIFALGFCLFAGRAWALSPNFESIRQELFNNPSHGCMDCHGKNPVLGRVPLHDYQALLRSPRDLVLPGNPDESGLVIAMRRQDKKQMPPPGPKYVPVSAAEIEVVRQWILRGAPQQAQGDSSGPAPVVTSGPPEAEYYRELLKSLRAKGTFKLPLPGGTNTPVSYQLAFGKGKREKPIVADFPAGEPGIILRQVFDKVYLDDTSVLKMGDEELPLTCVNLDSQDNRFGGKRSPITPDMILRVYLVANDYACNGPINHEPTLGKLGETWDNYLYYEVWDISTMMPVNAKLRFRGNDYRVVRTGGL